jgi:hypothetical protein
MRVPLLMAFSLLSCASVAWGEAKGPQGNDYASIARLPDWSGAWIIPWDAFAAENEQQRSPAYPLSQLLTPEYTAMFQAYANDTGQTRARISNSEACLPSGMPNAMRYAFALEFLFTPGRVTMVLEQGAVRRVYTDGRPHAQDPDFTYYGESIGHWEGQTLVIHTTAISAKAELRAGVHTSGRAQVTERIQLNDKDHLQIDTVVEDPVALKGPWRITRIYERTPPVFFERVCMENNRDVDGGEPDLTPP